MLRVALRTLLIMGAVVLSTKAAAEGTSIPDGERNMRLVGRSVEIMEDPLGLLSFEEALVSDLYHRADDDVPDLGLTSSTYWVRFILRHNATTHGLQVLVTHPEIEEFDGYVILPDQRVLHTVSGQARARQSWTHPDLDHLLRVPISYGEQATVLLRVRSQKQLQLPIYVGTADATMLKRSWRDGVAGSYLGIILVMMLYNLFIYFSTRDTSYRTYCIYIALVGITQANFMGMGKAFIWPDSTWFAVKASVILTVATAVMANLFMQHFINTRVHAPRLARLSWIFYALFAAGLTLDFTVAPLLGYELLQISVGSMALYQMGMAIYVSKQGSRTAKYFLIAWCLFLLGIVIYLLKDFGILPYNEFTKYIMTFGAAAEVVLLSFGLADKINILRREKERSQAEALAASQENERIIREQNTMLEHKVKERTHALEQSHEHLKHTQAQLVNAEKMASLGQLTAGIAHEINNPINFITSNILPLRRNIKEIMEVMRGYQALPPEGSAKELLELKELEARLDIATSIEELDGIIDSIAEGSSRTAEIVRGLRNFSRLDEDDLKEADLNEGIRSTLTVLGPQYRDRIRFDLELNEIPKVECFPGKVNQVFMNILTNAAQAALARSGPWVSKVVVRTEQQDDHAIVIIADNGIGMTEDVKARIFDPFFTTKDVGEGTGLGLAIVYGIVQEHHGSISVESTPQVGTTFRIVLPMRQQNLRQRRA